MLKWTKGSGQNENFKKDYFRNFVGIFYSVDKKQIGSNENPIFAVKVFTLKDGGTKEYYGLGYKIIKYNKMGENGEIEKDNWEIGSFMLKYE